MLIGVGAGSCGPAPTPQPPGSTTTARGVAEPTGPVGDRHTTFDVADNMRPQAIEFYDAYTAYLLLVGCDNLCQGAMFVTFDGGQSWLERKLPVRDVKNLQMYLVDAETVVLVAEPGGWFRSTDSGRTFTSGGPGLPGAAALPRGALLVGCPDGAECASGQVLLDGVPVPVQPKLAGNLRMADRAEEGTIWAISTAGQAVHTATSRDGGRTWQQFGAPITPRGVDMLELHVAPDGSDVWLVASAGTGPVSVHKVEATGWRQVTEGLDLGNGRVASAAAGQGVLAVAGGNEFGYLYSGGRWAPSRRPLAAQWVKALPDGTLVTLSTPGDVWLGTGNGAARTWNHVTVAVS